MCTAFCVYRLAYSPLNNMTPAVATDRLLCAPPCVCTAFYVHHLACSPLNNMTPAVATDRLVCAPAMGIVTKWAIRLQTSDFYGPSPPTPNPPPPMLGADFCSMTRLHALPLYHTLLWKMEKTAKLMTCKAVVRARCAGQGTRGGDEEESRRHDA